MNTAALLQVMEEVERDDRTGATELVLVAAEALREWGRAAEPLEDADLQDVVQRVASLRPSMASFLNLADAMARAAAAEPPSRRGSAIAEAAAEMGRQVAGEPRRIATALLEATGIEERTIATYSAGSSVRAALLALHHGGRPLRVVVSEARPACEGSVLAADLAKAGIPVRLVTDAALPSQVPAVGALWLGADALVPDGLVHKIGTLPLAREARRAGARVRVLAGRSKWVGPDLAGRLGLEMGDPSAVHPGAEGLEVANPLFDRTPWDLLDHVVSEEGSLPADRARDVLAGLVASPFLATRGAGIA